MNENAARNPYTAPPVDLSKIPADAPRMPRDEYLDRKRSPRVAKVQVVRSVTGETKIRTPWSGRNREVLEGLTQQSVSWDSWDGYWTTVTTTEQYNALVSYMNQQYIATTSKHFSNGA